MSDSDTIKSLRARIAELERQIGVMRNAIDAVAPPNDNQSAKAIRGQKLLAFCVYHENRRR